MTPTPILTDEFEIRRGLGCHCTARGPDIFPFTPDHELHAGSGYAERDLAQQQWEMSDNRRTRD